MGARRAVAVGFSVSILAARECGVGTRAMPRKNRRPPTAMSGFGGLCQEFHLHEMLRLNERYILTGQFEKWGPSRMTRRELNSKAAISAALGCMGGQSPEFRRIRLLRARAEIISASFVGWAKSSRPTVARDGGPRRLGPPYKAQTKLPILFLPAL